MDTLTPMRIARIMILLSITLLSACDNGQATSQPYHHQVAATPVVRQQHFDIERYFVGQVRANQRAQLGFEVAGTLAELVVDEGDKVAAGQLLASLDSSLLASELAVITAESEDLKARRRLAQRDLQRQRDLIRQGFASEQRIDELESELDSLGALIRKQEALLTAAKTRLRKHSLKAPYDGQVAQLYSDTGSVAVPGEPVLLILEQGRDELQVGIPRRLLAQVKVGDEARVRINDQDQMVSVLAVSTHVDNLTRTAMVRLALPAGQEYVDGQLGYLALPERVEHEGFWIPDTALSASVRGMWNVYALMREEGSELQRIESRSVELLHMAHGQAYVSGAVKDGEQLVASGVHRVLPGLSVRVETGAPQ